MRVESILFLKLKAFQLVADVLPADVVQAPGVVTCPDKLLPEFPGPQKGEFPHVMPSGIMVNKNRNGAHP